MECPTTSEQMQISAIVTNLMECIRSNNIPRFNCIFNDYTNYIKFDYLYLIEYSIANNKRHFFRLIWKRIPQYYLIRNIERLVLFIRQHGCVSKNIKELIERMYYNSHLDLMLLKNQMGEYMNAITSDPRLFTINHFHMAVYKQHNLIIEMGCNQFGCFDILMEIINDYQICSLYVNRLIDKAADVELTRKNEHGVTLLHAAVKSGKIKIVKKLLERNIFTRNELTNDKSTVLHFISHEEPKMVNLLATVNNHYLMDAYSVTPLHKFASAGMTQCCRALITRATLLLNSNISAGFRLCRYKAFSEYPIDAAAKNFNYVTQLYLHKYGTISDNKLRTKDGLPTMVWQNLINERDFTSAGVRHFNKWNRMLTFIIKRRSLSELKRILHELNKIDRKSNGVRMGAIKLILEQIKIKQDFLNKRNTYRSTIKKVLL